MSNPTPVRDGFRAAWRQPTLVLAEIGWRWSFGAAALLLASLALAEFLRTLIVTPGDMFLLRTGNPALIARALADIFAGSGPRFVASFLVLTISLTAFWIILGAFGRKATLVGLWERLAPEVELGHSSVRPLLGLNFLRAALLLASIAAIFGAGLAVSFLSTPKHPHHTLPFLLFIPLAMLIVALSSALQWFLALAALMAVRDGRDTFSALSAAMDFSRTQTRKISATSFWFALLHITAFTIATTVVGFPLSMASLVPGTVTLVLVAIITLVYFAVVDSLHIARLGGYLTILEWDRRPPEPESPPAPLPITMQVSMLKHEFPPDDDILCEILARESAAKDTSQQSLPPGARLASMPKPVFPPEDDILSDILARESIKD